MELVKRYIAAVQRELPENKREEIGRELNANIMDQLDALGEQQGELSAGAVATLLKQFGHPRVVAQQFVPPLPLINSAYMSLYKNTLFMVLGVLFVLQVVGSTMAWLSSANMGLVRYFMSIASGFGEDATFAFTAITISFWLISRKQPEPNNSGIKNWQPEQLAAVGPNWQHIKLQDIFTDLATYIFLMVVIWYPQFMSAEQIANNSVLLSDQVRLLLKWSTPVIALGIGNTLWQLRMRLWSRSMLVLNVAVNALFATIALFIATTTPLLQVHDGPLQKLFTQLHLEQGAVGVLVVIAIIAGWEVVRDVWRLRGFK